jgi:hypothetical protein
MRKFIDPYKIGKQSDVLKVDQYIQYLVTAGLLADRWRDEYDPKWFARRALEVSIQSALEASEVRDLQLIIDKCSDIQKKTKSALASIDEFVASISESQPNGEYSSILNYPVEHLLRVYRRRGVPYDDISEEITAELAALSKARKFIEDYHDLASFNRWAMSSNRQNPGEPEKHSFAMVWSEAWYCLVGKRPGKGTERNPFLRLLADAWEDACGEIDASFVSALRNGVAKKTCWPDTLPKWTWETDY